MPRDVIYMVINQYEELVTYICLYCCVEVLNRSQIMKGSRVLMHVLNALSIR